MRKLFSGISRPARIIIDIDPSPTIDRKHNTIHVNDPHDQFQYEQSGGDTATAGAAVVGYTLPLFDKDDPIIGRVKIIPDKQFEHQGIKIELIGEIVMYFESKQVSQFTQLSKELAPAGAVTQEMTLDFAFKNVEKEYESYRGINADLRYYLKVTITRSMFSMTKEQEFWVHCPGKTPLVAHDEQTALAEAVSKDPGIHMEVGLEGIVLLSIKYDHVYHELSKGGIIEGKLKFYMVNVKIDKAEMSIIKKETTGTQGDFAVTEQETLKKFEIIDGTPYKDEVVPVRLFLSSIDAWKMTPSVANVNNKFSVRYYLHLALLDTKGRRFFKQREIVLWRQPPVAVTAGAGAEGNE